MTPEERAAHIEQWLSITDDELEDIKAQARAEAAKGCHVLIARDLIRLIAVIRNMRGCCPNCGQMYFHRQGCKAAKVEGQ